MVTVGTPVNVQVYGEAPSSAKDTTLIKASFTAGGAVVTTEDLTVFKGVKIYFKGKFISNVNSRPEGWRPSDPDPATAQDIDDYSSTILFQKGDQGKPQRAWAPDPNVVVTKVEAQTPKFELTTDPLKGAKMHCLSGAFIGDPAREWVIKPSIEFKSGGVLLSGENPKPYLANATKIVTAFAGAVTAAERAAEEAYINNVPNGPNTTLLKDYYKDRLQTAANFRYHVSATWTNSKFRLAAGAGANTSMAVRAILIEQDVTADKFSKISLLFTKYEIWDLGGEVEDGVIEIP